MVVVERIMKNPKFKLYTEIKPAESTAGHTIPICCQKRALAVFFYLFFYDLRDLNRDFPW